MPRFLRRIADRLAAALPPPPDPFDGQTGWRVDGNDWPAGQCGTSLGEVYEALDAITTDTCEAARLSLLAQCEADHG